MKTSTLSRRDFIKISGISGIALTLGVHLSAKANDKVEITNLNNTDSLYKQLMSWISIDSSGKVTIMTHRSEMGQGTFQVIPQMIAEELEIDLDHVNIQFAAANPKKFGPQPQDGSFSVRGWYKQLLKVGASAREMLIETAAKRWNIPVSECYAENGQVIHRPTSKSLGYGDLVEEASSLTPPKDVRTKARKDYKIIGKSLPRQDIPLKTNGTAVFGLDKKIPGMLYAVVERNPRFRGKVKSFDDAGARNISGVKHVLKVQRPVFADMSEGVAVVADTLWAAMQGRKALRVEWNDDGFEHHSSEQLHAQMLENLRKPAPSEKFDAALQRAEKTIEAVYETPYQSHSCMEPLNCIADVKDTSIEIWGPIQEANWIQADLSQRMGIPVENITVNMTFLGGGFGRKAFPDYPYEAALISKEVKAPVQVVWTREDDMTAGPFRPGAYYLCKGGLDDSNKIVAYQTTTATQWFGQEWTPNPSPAPGTLPYNAGSFEGLLSPFYKSFPHYSFGAVGTRSPIPTMWWRSVYASTGGFACESFIDELAHEAKQDPLDFRKSHLPDTRYQALIDKLDAVSGWSFRKKNTGWGMAATECFGGIVGHIVKVSQQHDKKIKIDKVFAVIDCGWYVNPDIIKAQIEGSIVMAMGAAIKHETHFKDGKAVEKNFDSYKMPRISEIPEIEVHIMENDENAGGVGEPGLPPFAPALCNAIFDLTGKRIRKLPFDLDQI
jgi:isoquinoline 1-oxidoreductase subunit beta